MFLPLPRLQRKNGVRAGALAVQVIADNRLAVPWQNPTLSRLIGFNTVTEEFTEGHSVVSIVGFGMAHQRTISENQFSHENRRVCYSAFRRAKEDASSSDL